MKILYSGYQKTNCIKFKLFNPYKQVYYIFECILHPFHKEYVYKINKLIISTAKKENYEYDYCIDNIDFIYNIIHDNKKIIDDYVNTYKKHWYNEKWATKIKQLVKKDYCNIQKQSPKIKNIFLYCSIFLFMGYPIQDIPPYTKEYISKYETIINSIALLNELLVSIKKEYIQATNLHHDILQKCNALEKIETQETIKHFKKRLDSYFSLYEIDTNFHYFDATGRCGDTQMIPQDKYNRIMKNFNNVVYLENILKNKDLFKDYFL